MFAFEVILRPFRHTVYERLHFRLTEPIMVVSINPSNLQNPGLMCFVDRNRGTRQSFWFVFIYAGSVPTKSTLTGFLKVR